MCNYNHMSQCFKKYINIYSVAHEKPACQTNVGVGLGLYRKLNKCK